MAFDKYNTFRSKSTLHTILTGDYVSFCQVAAYVYIYKELTEEKKQCKRMKYVL